VESDEWITLKVLDICLAFDMEAQIIIFTDATGGEYIEMDCTVESG
jgi:type IV secretory pathway VirB4 component